MREEKKSRREFFWITLLFICYSAAMILATVGSRTVTASARNGMRLAVEVILPSVLPFMMFSDIAAAIIDFSAFRRSGELFGRIFGIGGGALAAIAIGSLAGFPVGARMVADMYRSGALSRSEAERAAVISSTPSLAFTVSGVGSGMLGSSETGLALYFSVITASLLYGILTRKASLPTSVSDYKRPSPDLARSISSAATASLGIVVSVTLFSVIAGLICKMIRGNLLLSLILPFIEVSSACAQLAEGEGLSLVLAAFALGFSGLSVHAQIRASIADTDLGYSRFLVGKLAVGLLSAVIFFILKMLIK